MTSISKPAFQMAEEESHDALNALQDAVVEAIERKRRLGQYWVVWDGEKPVEIHPGDHSKTAAE
jgi:hypothetical protein